MGQSCSLLNFRQLEKNSLLKDLFGKQCIPLEEPFWNQFLSFDSDVLLTKSLHKSLWTVLQENYGYAVVENYKTGNVVNLIAMFIKYAKEIVAIYQSGDSEKSTGGIWIKQARNALLVIRFVIQCMVVSKSEGTDGLILLLEVECLPQQAKEDGSDSYSVFDEFVDWLLKLLFQVTVNDASQELHIEVLLTMLLLLNCHVFTGVDIAVEHSDSLKKRSFLRAIMGQSNELVKYLLNNIIDCKETPKAILQNTSNYVNDRPTSIMVASFDCKYFLISELCITTNLLGLKNIFHSAETKVVEEQDDVMPNTESPNLTNKADLVYALSNHSLIICIILSCSDFSYFFGEEDEQETISQNAFLRALSSFTDSQVQIASSPTSKSADIQSPFSVSISSLCHSLSNSLSDGIGLRRRPALVLLYLLLHHNSSFKACVLSRSDIDRLAVPLLRILYTYTSYKDRDGDKEKDRDHEKEPVITPWNRDHAYLALICLLIFTEDDSFCRFVNDLSLNSKTLTSFYTEHSDASALGNDPSLASLSLLVFLRAIRRNLLIGRDHYLHTSCLAALANQCAHASDINAAVASRLVDLLVALARRRVRLCAILRTTAPGIAYEDTEAALSATDDTARLLLEAIYAALYARGRGPGTNANLVVSLLREQDAISSAYRNVANFQDLLQNVQFIMNYFAAHLDQESSPSSPQLGPPSKISIAQNTVTSVSEVLRVVKTASSHFPLSRLRKMPDLKFHYVEESSASSHFFLPYALTLYRTYSYIYWPPIPGSPEVDE